MCIQWKCGQHFAMEKHKQKSQILCISYSNWILAMKVDGFSVKLCSWACKANRLQTKKVTSEKQQQNLFSTLILAPKVAESQDGSGTKDMRASAVLTWAQSTPPSR